MGAIRHTEKFVVEVVYKGKRKSFEDIFKSKHTVCNLQAQSVDHSTKTIETQSVRSDDQRAVREFLRQCVTKAGFNPCNAAKSILNGSQCRVDYMSKSDRDNRIVDFINQQYADHRRRRHHNQSSNPMRFSVYTEHFFTGIVLDNNNLKLYSAKYDDPPDWTASLPNPPTIQDRLYVKVEYPKSVVSWTDAQGKKHTQEIDDHNSPIFYSQQTEVCFSDPNSMDQIVEYFKSLKI